MGTMDDPNSRSRTPVLLLAALAVLAGCQPQTDDFTRGAEQGDAEAQFNLARRYATGSGGVSYLNFASNR